MLNFDKENKQKNIQFKEVNGKQTTANSYVNHRSLVGSLPT